MTYPKPVMSITELLALGFTRDYLNRMVHHKMAYKYAIKTSNRGKWYIDTEEFEKLRSKGRLV